MKKIAGTPRNSTIVALFIILANCSILAQDADIQDQDFLSFNKKLRNEHEQVIQSIKITGNEVVPTQAILAKVPYRVGEAFNPKKSAQTIRAIHLLGYFQNIQVVTHEVSPTELVLNIIVTEKPRISGIEYEGNSVLTNQKLNEKLETKLIKTLDEKELKNLGDQIKKLYREKNYHHATVTGELRAGDDDTYVAHFTIDEGVRSRVRVVNFTGNDNIPEKALRSKIFTREDWVMGFFDKSGTYHPDAVLQDRYVIENFYQSNGYLAARVIETKVNEDEYGDIDVTFIVDEGDLYTISKIEAPGNELLTEEQVLRRIPIFCGQLYSKDRIRKTMEMLRQLWGEYGYIYADVQPSIRPDEKTKTVTITFNTDLGNRIYVNRINVIGNRKTKDKVIRREILFNEGEILTTRMMEESKTRVQLLGFFDQKDGVNWKITKVDDETADLDLVVQEIKTGKVYAKMGIGAQADMSSPTNSFSVGAGLHDINFLGSGIKYNITGSYAAQDKMFNASIGNSWFFDRPIYAGGDAYLRKTTYEDFKQTQNHPIEALKGGGVRLGFRLPQFSFIQMGMSGGYEKISYEGQNIAKTIFTNDADLQAALQAQVDRTFQPGSVAYFGTSISQDMRNHPTFPTEGYDWLFDAKVGIPHGDCSFGFFKFGLDGHWYTPIIQEHNVILHLHGFLGYLTDISNHAIPYRELFHIGGPATVRGFKYGQIGPSMLGSSLGATKAMTVTAELKFPITADGNMRGWFFYDGGSGWDTPDACQLPSALLQNNMFEFRHAIGFGFSMINPTPVRIDWGFKLDRKKKRDEGLSEVHISMSQSF